MSEESIGGGGASGGYSGPMDYWCATCGALPHEECLTTPTAFHSRAPAARIYGRFVALASTDQPDGQRRVIVGVPEPVVPAASAEPAADPWNRPMTQEEIKADCAQGRQRCGDYVDFDCCDNTNPAKPTRLEPGIYSCPNPKP